MPKPNRCKCGADLNQVRTRRYFDDVNDAINRSAVDQCVPCYAHRYMKPSDGFDLLFSADAMSWLGIDQGRYPRSSYVVLATATGSTLYR